VHGEALAINKCTFPSKYFFPFATVKVPQIADKTLDNVFLCTLEKFFGKFLYSGIFLRGLGRGYDVSIQKQ